MTFKIKEFVRIFTVAKPSVCACLNSVTGPNWTTGYVGAPYLGYQAKMQLNPQPEHQVSTGS